MQVDIKGSTMPVLEIQLDQGEAVITPHGEVSWMTPNVQLSQTTTTGGPGGLMSTIKRAASGGGLLVTRYQSNKGTGLVAFAAKVPGHIVPVEVAAGRSKLVHQNGWLCSTPGVNVSVALQRSLRSGLWGGEGFRLQRLEGKGNAWIELSGEVTRYTLGAGRSLLVHPGHVGMFDSTVKFSITTVPGITNKIFGGDGFLLVSLTGPGEVWLQSMPLPNLAHAIEQHLPRESSRARPEHGSGMGWGKLER